MSDTPAGMGRAMGILSTCLAVVVRVVGLFTWHVAFPKHMIQDSRAEAARLCDLALEVV